MEFDMDKYDDYFSHGKIISALPYMIEAVTNALSGVYDMKYCDKGRWWYGEWEGDRRKVVTLASSKGTLRNICWGWNYNYIPHRASGDKLSYARTDKSFCIDIGDSFFLHVDYNSDVMTHYETYDIRKKYMFPKDTNNIEVARMYMKTVCERNIPFMIDFFNSVNDDETALKLDENRRKEKPWLFGPLSRSGWSEAFILAKHGRLEEAKYMISHVYYSDGYCPENVMKKLCEVAENS